MEADEYYGYEEEEYESYEVALSSETPWWMQKAVPVLISAAFHIVCLWAAAFLIFTIVSKEPPPRLIVVEENIVPSPIDWTAPPGLITKPKIEGTVIHERVILNLDEEAEITKNTPRGTSDKNRTDKELGGTSVNDAYGIGGSPSGAYGHRYGTDKFSLPSGSDPTVGGVDRALRWLHFHQDRDGRWDQDGFDKNCDPKLGSSCDGRGTGQYDPAVSGLALLGFLGKGHTHRVGEFKKTVKRGLDWLVGQQRQDGSIGARDCESWIYNHAIATMALCEAYAITRDYRLRGPAQKAIDYIRSSQNPGLGWKYESGSGRNDTSVTGWMVLALKAAKTARLDVDESMFDGAINWFDRATNSSGKCGYMRPGDDGSVIRGVNEHYAKLPTMTAASVICRIFCGQSRRNKKVLDGVDYLMANLPKWDKLDPTTVDMYYWYYGTYAVFQYGGNNWKKWNESMIEALLKTQRVGGCADGSWDPVGKWGMVGGRVYSTAINALTFEIYYRYERIKESNSQTAARK